MTTYNVSNQLVHRIDDLWTLPVLRETDGGLLEHGELVIRITDGVACEPMTSGPASGLNDWDIWEITPSGPLAGWGDKDCGHSYRLRNCLVSGPVLEKVAEWSGLQLPAVKIYAGYVRTPDGNVYVQRPDDNQWGFTLYDDDQSYPGGFGVGSKWTAVSEDQVSEADRDRLGWLLEEIA